MNVMYLFKSRAAGGVNAMHKALLFRHQTHIHTHIHTHTLVMITCIRLKACGFTGQAPDSRQVKTALQSTAIYTHTHQTCTHRL